MENRTSTCGALVLPFVLFSSLVGCAEVVRIDDPVEPFSVPQPLAEQIVVRSRVEHDGRGYSEIIKRSLDDKLVQTLLHTGLVKTILPTSASERDAPTLSIVARGDIDMNNGRLLLNIFIGAILLPLFPFLQHTFTYTVSADVSVVQPQHSTQVVVLTSTLHHTHTMFRLFDFAEPMSLVVEDLSNKIALELKRHPDWLRAAPVGSP